MVGDVYNPWVAWDTDRTKRRLLEAAVIEFAEHGAAGARVDRIAGAAGVNKERLYGYFGSKAGLFAAVLSDELTKLSAAVPLEFDETHGLGDYAVGVFDYHAENPWLLRLLHWEGLEGAVPIVDHVARASHYADKVASIRRAQGAGLLDSQRDAGELLYAVLALAAWWFAAPQISDMILGADHRERRRDMVRALADRLGRPPSA